MLANVWLASFGPAYYYYYYPPFDFALFQINSEVRSWEEPKKLICAELRSACENDSNEIESDLAKASPCLDLWNLWI